METCVAGMSQYEIVDKLGEGECANGNTCCIPLTLQPDRNILNSLQGN